MVSQVAYQTIVDFLKQEHVFSLDEDILKNSLARIEAMSGSTLRNMGNSRTDFSLENLDIIRTEMDINNKGRFITYLLFLGTLFSDRKITLVQLEIEIMNLVGKSKDIINLQTFESYR